YHPLSIVINSSSGNKLTSTRPNSELSVYIRARLVGAFDGNTPSTPPVHPQPFTVQSHSAVDIAIDRILITNPARRTRGQRNAPVNPRHGPRRRDKASAER
ncbi:unnamed protein product, partial [Nesidiocoris tenuis]